MFLTPSGSRASRSLAYNPTVKNISEQVWRLNTDIPPFLEHGACLEDPYTLHHIDPNLCNQYQDQQHTHTGNLPRVIREIKELVIYQTKHINFGKFVKINS